jgi:hypothetical protein
MNFACSFVSGTEAKLLTARRRLLPSWPDKLAMRWIWPHRRRNLVLPIVAVLADCRNIWLLENNSGRSERTARRVWSSERLCIHCRVPRGMFMPVARLRSGHANHAAPSILTTRMFWSRLRVWKGMVDSSFRIEGVQFGLTPKQSLHYFHPARAHIPPALFMIS